MIFKHFSYDSVIIDNVAFLERKPGYQQCIKHGHPYLIEVLIQLNTVSHLYFHVGMIL